MSLIPEKELIHFIEMTPDLVCVASKKGYFLRVNQSVIDTLKYSLEELKSRPISSFIHPDDREFTAGKRKELLEGNVLVNFDNRYVTGDGSTVWLQWSSIYFPEKDMILALAKNVTVRKLRENETEEKYLKYKDLTSHFKSSLEKEKKTLAGELHEELAQIAFSVKMDLDWLNTNNRDLSDEAKEKLRKAFTGTSLLISSIRKLSYAISPNMLEDVGIKETIEWLCAEFETIHGIPCTLECNPELKNISREIKVDLFRICQEALLNIFGNAVVNKLTLKITEPGQQIRLSIRGEGKGYEQDQLDQLLNRTSLRERSDSIGAIIKIRTEPGTGTFFDITFSPH